MVRVGFAHGQEKNIAQIASETPDLSILVEAAKVCLWSRVNFQKLHVLG